MKFIKFFAWEERWIKRALEAREVEMQWMIKGSVFSRLALYTFLILACSSDKFGHVLTHLDMCSNLGFSFVILCLCYERQ